DRTDDPPKTSQGLSAERGSARTRHGRPGRRPPRNARHDHPNARFHDALKKIEAAQLTFEEAEKYLYSLGNEVEAMKLGLENIRTLLAALGDPHRNYKKVQVAG